MWKHYLYQVYDTAVVFKPFIGPSYYMTTNQQTQSESFHYLWSTQPPHNMDGCLLVASVTSKRLSAITRLSLCVPPPPGSIKLSSSLYTFCGHAEQKACSAPHGKVHIKVRTLQLMKWKEGDKGNLRRQNSCAKFFYRGVIESILTGNSTNWPNSNSGHRLYPKKLKYGIMVWCCGSGCKSPRCRESND